MKYILKLTTTVIILASVSQVHAANYDLHALSGTVVGGNTTSGFYEVTGAGAESGTASGLYSSTLGGDAGNGFWVRIDFGSNPQPVLDSAFLKAANEYLWWDASDLFGFNSGTFDSITLWNDSPGGIQNSNNKFQGTSHAGLNGVVGTGEPPGGNPSVTVPTNVPDTGSSLVLFGLALTALGNIRHRLT